MHQSTLHVASGQHPVFRPQAGVTLHLLSAGSVYQVFLIEVAANTRCQSPAHEGEELRYVIGGRVIFTLADRDYVMAAGDTLRHPSSARHGFRTEDGACTFLTVAFSRDYDISTLFRGTLEGDP